MGHPALGASWASTEARGSPLKKLKKGAAVWEWKDLQLRVGCAQVNKGFLWPAPHRLQTDGAVSESTSFWFRLGDGLMF